MTERNRTHDRDEVLYAFHLECTQPTAEEVIAWAKRYPEYADDIRAHATIARDWSDATTTEEVTADDELLNTAHSQALNLIYQADHSQALDAPKTFQEFLLVRGTNAPAIARAIGIARSVIADLISGKMIPPVGLRLINALMSFLTMTRDQFDMAVTLARQKPSLGNAKSDRPPTLIGVTYAQSIQDSGMDAEAQRYWLEDCA